VKLLAENVDCSVINAGDGTNEHPTQALVDAATIMQAKGEISGLKVAICGDIVHSRVARSNIHLLTKMGADVRVIAPKTFLPDDNSLEERGVEVFTSMKEGLEDVDVVMMLRIQKERLQTHEIPSPRDFYKSYGLSVEKLAYAKPDAKVMHPGPINRGVEIASEVADNRSRSLILEQVEMGVPVRQALLEHLAE
jgi:aspartate carbamoyltransferase catalytic subunit